VLPDLRVQLVLRARLAPQVLKGQLGLPVQQAPLEPPVSLGLRDSTAWKALRASRGPRAHRAPLDLLGHKERPARQELQERLVLQEIRGQQDLMVWMVPRV
jgi:hypothetical protein